MPTKLSAKCAAVAEIPRSATIPGPVFAAHVSVANCTVEEAMNRVTLSPNDTSIAALNRAVAPSLAMLDSVIATGDSYWRLIAADAKRDIYESMVVRMRDSIKGPDLAAHNALEPKLAAWQDDAARERMAVAELSRDSTLARRDPVIAGIVERNASATATAVAKRPQRPRG